MNDKIEIINFLQDRNFKDRYHQETPGIELHFKTFKHGPTRDQKIIRQGAKTCIWYYTPRETHITGLIPIKGMPNIYFGDIKEETAAIWIHPQKESISIAVFKGHRPKIRSARQKKVINYINALLKSKNKG